MRVSRCCYPCRQVTVDRQTGRPAVTVSNSQEAQMAKVTRLHVSKVLAEHPMKRLPQTFLLVLALMTGCRRTRTTTAEDLYEYARVDGVLCLAALDGLTSGDTNRAASTLEYIMLRNTTTLAAINAQQNMPEKYTAEGVDYARKVLARIEIEGVSKDAISSTLSYSLQAIANLLPTREDQERIAALQSKYGPAFRLELTNRGFPTQWIDVAVMRRFGASNVSGSSPNK
jgi:hypothetical protein